VGDSAVHDGSNFVIQTKNSPKSGQIVEPPVEYGSVGGYHSKPAVVTYGRALVSNRSAQVGRLAFAKYLNRSTA